MKMVWCCNVCTLAKELNVNNLELCVLLNNSTVLKNYNDHLNMSLQNGDLVIYSCKDISDHKLILCCQLWLFWAKVCSLEEIYVRLQQTSR